jgi:glycosyltransferase involved in cell wall biosynthesis
MQEEEVVQILLDSDIFCQTSHIENSPNSLCEAMILGMPIIASLAGGTSSMLKNNKEGLLIQEGDPYSFAGAILELSNDFIKAKTYGQAAKLLATQRNGENSIKNHYVEIYKEIYSSGRDENQI